LTRLNNKCPTGEIAVSYLRRQSESRVEPKPLGEIVDQGDGGRPLVALGERILRDRVQALKRPLEFVAPSPKEHEWSPEWFLGDVVQEMRLLDRRKSAERDARLLQRLTAPQRRRLAWSIRRQMNGVWVDAHERCPAGAQRTHMISERPLATPKRAREELPLVPRFVHLDEEIDIADGRRAAGEGAEHPHLSNVVQRRLPGGDTRHNVLKLPDGTSPRNAPLRDEGSYIRGRLGTARVRRHHPIVSRARRRLGQVTSLPWQEPV
jgi:hypothetical protein